MRIGLVSSEYPPFRGGGIGTYTAVTARLLAEAGHEVHVIANGWSRTDDRQDFASHGIGGGGALIHHRIPALTADYRPGPAHDGPGDPDGWVCRARECSIYWSLQVARALDGLDVPLDVIEFPECFAEGWATLARRGALHGAVDAPVAITLHSPIHEIAEFNLLRRTEAWIQRRAAAEDAAIRAADGVSSPSGLLADRVAARLDLHRAAVSVIPNPLDFELLDGVVPAASGDPPTLVFAGRIEPRKGLVNLVRAAVRLLQSGHDEVKVELIGRSAPAGAIPGTLTDQLLTMIPDDLRDRFLFRDQAPRQEVLQRFAGATACVFMPDWDNFPYTCCEAMAVGGAVVVSEHSGMAEMVEDGRSGVVVPPWNGDRLVEALSGLLEDPGLGRMLGAAAAERIRDLCGAESVLPARIAFYEETIDRRKAAKKRSVVMPDPTVGTRPRLAVLVLEGSDATAVDATLASLAVACRGAGLALDASVAGPADGQTAAERAHPEATYLRGDDNASAVAAWTVDLENLPPDLVLCLRAGETVDETYVDICRRVFERRDDAAWATTWSLPLDSALGEPFAGLDFTLPLDLTDHHPVPFAIIRWSDLQALGGWNTELPDGWREWDFWLAAAAAGRAGVVVPQWCAHHRVGSGQPFPVEHPKAYEMTLEAVARRSATVFAEHAVDLWIKSLVDRLQPPAPAAPRSLASMETPAGEGEEKAEGSRQDFVDLLRRLDTARVDAPEAHVGEAAFFDAHPLGGIGLLAHPPTTIAFTVDVADRSFLNLSLMVHPDVHDRPGGGVEFVVRVEGEELLRETVDPKRQPEHRGWKDCSLDLGRFAGVGRTLELVTSSFPGDDNRFCTAGWGRIHLAAEPFAPAPSGAAFQR
jgi:glycogen(starch) synthase